MRVLVTTDPGLEDLVRDELAQVVPQAVATRPPYAPAGVLRVELADAQLESLYTLRTAHHVIEVLGEMPGRTLADVARIAGEVPIPALAAARSFRVTTEHVGALDVARMKVQGIAGAEFKRRYDTAVDLEGFGVEVRVDLLGDQVVVGVQRTRRSLSKRLRRARAIRSSLRPTVGAAMIRLVGAHRGGGRLIDPLCGTGTIPIEAAEINPELDVEACDWDAETVTAARETIANHDLTIEVRDLDARDLDRAYDVPFDYIVTDPPYGVRQGRRADLVALYSGLLAAFERSLTENGRIAIVVVKFRAFLRALAPTALDIVDERLIDVGGLHPRIFVLERRGRGGVRRRGPA